MCVIYVVHVLKIPFLSLIQISYSLKKMSLFKNHESVTERTTQKHDFTQFLHGKKTQTVTLKNGFERL